MRWFRFRIKSFSIFGVDAEATDLSLEYKKRGVEDGIERGHRFLLRGQLELKFPKFDPNLRIAASFASGEEGGLVDLSETLGTAWTFALAEEPDLAGIDASADDAPEVEDTPEDSFIRLEFKPDGSLGLDAVGRIALENFKLSELVTVDNAFLQIDTVNDNYLGFVRATTPIKRAGEINALLGIEGGELDLVALGVGQLNNGVGIQIGTTPMYLQAIGGGLKDLNDGVRGVDLIAAVTTTLGPSTANLFKGFTLPDFLGGASFEPGNLLQIDVGGNISLEGLNLGGQVVVGGDEDGGILVGTGNVAVNFVQPSAVINARLEAFGGLLRLEGLNGGDFASLAVNSNFDVAAQGRVVAQLPDELPFPLGFAEGATLGSASGVLEFTNDSVAENDYLAFWGELPLFTNPFTGNPVTAVAGLQVFLAPRFPNLITSLGEAQSIAGEGEGEFTTQRKFSIEADSPYAMFASTWDSASATAMIELVDPTGTVFTEADIENEQAIILVESSSTSRTIAVIEPAAGEWTVRITDAIADDLGETNFTTFVEGDPLSIDVTSAVLSDADLTIDFETTEATEQSTVSLFIDSDQRDFDGTLLVADLPIATDGSGSFTIDTSGMNLPSGDYFVFAVLDEPGKPLVTSEYVETGFQISNTTELPAVENVMASWPGSNQLRVQWDTVESAVGYRLGITGDAAGAAIEQAIDVIGTSIVLTDELLSTPLTFGETYRVEVVAIDEDGGPGMTGGRAVGVVGPTDSVLPENGQLSVFAEPGSPYSGQFSFADGETISLTSGPDGSTVDGEGVFSWDVPAEASGFEELRIKIVPESGRIRYEEFVLFAGLSPSAEIGGQVIEDTDRNGSRDAGENGLSGVTVELVDLVDGTVVLSSVSVDIDLNDDDVIDPETEQGLFSFAGLAAGEYGIRRADVAATTERLTLLDGTLENIVLGQPSMSSLAGTVLDDINFDSAGDDLVQGVTVFLDLDDSGSLTEGDVTALTDAGGAYEFLNLPAGDLRFGMVPPTDFNIVGPTTQTITLGIDETSDGNDFVIQLNPAPTNAVATARIVNALTSQSIFNALNLGEVSVDGEGGDAFSVDLQLLNLGNENLVVTSATILDSEAGVTIDGLAAGTTIVPNSLVDESSGFPFTLNFDPTQSGVIDTFLSIESNDPNSPILVRLEGLARSTGPELSVQIDNNNAGGVNFGETEECQQFLDAEEHWKPTANDLGNQRNSWIRACRFTADVSGRSNRAGRRRVTEC